MVALGGPEGGLPLLARPSRRSGPATGCRRPSETRAFVNPVASPGPAADCCEDRSWRKQVRRLAARRSPTRRTCPCTARHLRATERGSCSSNPAQMSAVARRLRDRRPSGSSATGQARPRDCSPASQERVCGIVRRWRLPPSALYRRIYLNGREVFGPPARSAWTPVAAPATH